MGYMRSEIDTIHRFTIWTLNMTLHEALHSRKSAKGAESSTMIHVDTVPFGTQNKVCGVGLRHAIITGLLSIVFGTTPTVWS